MPKQNAVPVTPKQLQDMVLELNPKQNDIVRVRLVINDDTDYYDELLPQPMLDALLDPSVQDFFIPIKAVAKSRENPKRRYLHTSFIREVVLL